MADHIFRWSDAQPSGLQMAVVGDVPVGRLTVAGELDMHTAPRLHALLMDLLHRGYRRISIDAAGVYFCGAAGVNALGDTTRRYQQAGGQLQVVALAPHIRRILALARVDDELDMGEARLLLIDSGQADTSSASHG